MRRASFLRIASTIGCALVLAACGGDEQAEYEASLADVGRNVDHALARLPEDDRTTVGPEELDQLAGELRDAAQQLDEIDPPSEAADGQRQLERGMRGVADAFEQLADDLRDATDESDKAELFVSFATDPKAAKAFEDIDAAQAELAKHGIRVFGTKAPAKTS